MPQCPSCSADVKPAARFCDSCGTDLSDLTAAVSQAGSDVSLPHSSLLDQGRFAPGTLLDERYRVVGLLGRGGMGEVYRADDLKLGQSVALKFLPTDMEQDEVRLNLLLNEVRLARQVSHPNVCRVYDIGQIDGAHFMAMEYVDGEDLSSLLRRIGRLPHEKALEISRQICAGLAAAHEQGILHRDLKPANVMIDGRGRVKLTDFGLSGLATRIEGEDARVGTPAYMSPEQLSGREATQSSDIYALGLVLYEIFTGKRAFGGKSIAEIARAQQQSSLTSLSSLVTDIDETVERVVLRCLEMEPSTRPTSALAVAAALPGGDPLAAALAAGETPSPEMVADAVAPGSLKPVIAIASLAVIIASLLLSFAGSVRDDFYPRLPLEQSPDEMANHALQILDELGIPEPGPHRRRGLAATDGYADWVADNSDSADRWDVLSNPQPPAGQYWFRYSNDEMIPDNLHAFTVMADDPVQRHPGQGTIWLDFEGNLVSLSIVPDLRIEPTGSAADAGALFTAAGLSIADFTVTEPVVAPSTPTEVLQAWSGPVFGGLDGVVQAGWMDGHPTHFEIVGPWRLAEPEESGGGGVDFIFGFILVAILITAAVFARRNLGARRSDLGGTAKLMAFYVLSIYGAWFLTEVRLDTFSAGSLVEQLVFGRLLAHGLAHAALVGMLYIALEPYVRRLWPETLVSWSRLLIGRLRDPLVGRDVLFGMAVVGGATSLSIWGTGLVTKLAGLPALPNFAYLPAPFDGIRYALSWSIMETENAVTLGMVVLVGLLMIRLLVRRTWATILVFLILTAIGQTTNPLLPASAPVWAQAVGHLGAMLVLGAILFTLLRFGLLSLIAGLFFINMLSDAPLTWDMSQWYAGSGVVMTLLLIAVVIGAFYVSLGGRKLFKDSVMD